MVDIFRDHLLTMLWQLENIAAVHHWWHLAAGACHLAVWFGAYGPCLHQ